MGQSFNKDKNIDIYVETYKPITRAGQYIEGAIYLNCHASCNYSQLNLRLSCKQKVRWVEGSGQNTKYYHNSADTYNQVIPIFEFFDKSISLGQYAFPFRILLPSGLPGSFSESLDNGIRYTLSAQLLPMTKQQKLQHPQAIKSNIVNSPNCCDCCCKCQCCSYGTVNIQISSNKNQIRDGDQLKIQILIDNSKGKTQIKNVVVNLCQKYVQISNWGNGRYLDDIIQTLHTLKKPILPGTTQKINILSQVRQNFSSYSTSIGKIIAKYFAISICSSMGCCSQGADSSLHLVYHSNNPKIEQNKKMQPPTNWHPRMYNPVVYNNLAPYIYEPLQGIPFVNRQINFGREGYVNIQQQMSNNQMYGQSKRVFNQKQFETKY